MSQNPKLKMLFDAMVDELYDQTKNGATVKDAKGKPVKVSTPASTLNVARQLLQSLGINAAPENSEALKRLMDELPYHDDDDHSVH